LKDPVLIGSRVSIGEDYAGQISDVRVFDSVLTGQEAAKE
jgi:hypothetical protein